MLRFIATLATLTLVVTPLTVWLAPTNDATACSVVADTLDLAVSQSDVIALVQASEVGGPENAAPTLTATATPPRTPTAAGSRTPTPRPSPGSPTPAASATPPPPHVSLGFDLAGIGATLTVVESYFGAAGGTIVTDQEQRARIETYIREVEAGTAGIVGCPLNLDAYRYALGARYLTLFDREPSGGLRTRVHLRVDNADVVIRGTAVTTMTAETYHRFFEGIPATVNEADDYAQLTADRVPLSTMLRAITALRTGESPPAITPPETGTAGLASDR